ncbi:MAG TPA: DUF4249 domain-containing protein [Bacteroidales bacterium]|nr:DUF4249 domain-containing protein [Bacteroidales bacterium]
MSKTKTIVCFFVILVILFSSSCKKIVQSEFPDIEQKPVINGIIVQDSVIKINVSLSGKLDSNDLTFVENAVISLYVDDVLTETLYHSEEGMYISNIVAEPDKEYSCIVKIPDFDDVKCSCKIPPKTDILDVTLSNLAYIDAEGTIFPAVTIKFRNNPDTLLYYEVAIKNLRYDSYYERNDDFYASLVGIEDPVLINEGLPIAVFSNKIITGDEYTMTLNYFTMGTSWNLSHLYPIIVELRSINFEYYQYAQALYLYKKQLGNESIDGRILPLSIYSNVENGFGIFAGYSTNATDTIYPN